MVAINGELAEQVRGFLRGGDRAFLETMKTMDRNSIEGQSVVRYLMQLKHWPFTPESDFEGLLNHFFAEYPERPRRDPAEYQSTTFALIKNTFDYECIVVVPEPKAEVEAPAKKSGGRKPSTRKTISSQMDDPLDNSTTDIDTTGASDRMKRVIGIQRGG